MLKFLRALIRLIRPHQWTKNAFVLAGILFGERVASDGSTQHVLTTGNLPEVVVAIAEAVAAFCLVAGAVYILNDLKDVEQDRLHPRKRNRPIASGAISPWGAGVFGVVFAVAGLWLSYAIEPRMLWVTGVYLAINVLYTLWLKHEVVLDILSVASGFVLRVLAGVLAVQAIIGPWIVVCTMFLALLISLGKRRGEIVLLGDDAGEHRRILAEYPLEFLDMLIVTVAAMTVIAYALFTFESGRSIWLMLSIPPVLYGVFRYLYLLYVGKSTLPPEILVVKDARLLVTGVIWTLLTAALIALT